MLRRFVAILTTLAVLFSAPFSAGAQTQPAPGDPWARVRFLVDQGTVDVTTKAGLQLRGVLVRFVWEEITLRDKKGAIHIVQRVEVQEVRTVPDRKTMIRPVVGGAAVGATFGMIGGGVAAIDVPKAQGQRRFFAGLGIGAAIGTVAGLILGRSNIRPARTVYVAPPQENSQKPG